MHLRHCFPVLFLIAGSPAFLFAQHVPLPLRLADAVERARTANPAVRAARGKLDAAGYRVSEARSALLPQIRLTGRAAYLSDIPEFTVPFLGTDPLFPSINRSYAAKLTMQQNLFSGFRLRRSLEMSERNAEAVRAESVKDESDLVLTVTVAYWNLYRAVRAEDVLAQSVQQVSAHLTDVRNFRTQGLATDFDVLKVETRLSEIHVRHIEARSLVTLTQMSLNSLIGNALGTPVIPVDRPTIADTAEVAAPRLESLMQRAREQRPEAVAAKERRAMQEAALGLARGGWYPQILLSASYDYARPNQRVIPLKDAWEQTWDVGITFQWNIWDWFATSSQTAQARASLSVADAMLDQVHTAVALDAAQSYLKAVEAKERIAASTLGAKLAEEGFRIAQERYRQGMASNSDLLDAETALVQARLTETHAVVDYVVQLQRLNNATGDLR